MKRLAFLLIVLRVFAFAFGCHESPEEQRQDVQETEQEVGEDVRGAAGNRRRGPRGGPGDPTGRRDHC
jgi:hypothetical protein